MNIAYVHFHLKRGGVTSVIKHQVEAVGNAHQTLIISSSKKCPICDSPAAYVPCLQYDTESYLDVTPEKLAREIEAAIFKTWPQGCDVIHVHNPTLAKNSDLIEALRILKDRGFALFLQIHDFAEDGRPNVYYKKPYLEDVHYGVINSRDYNILLQAGLKKEGLHLIPNQVDPFAPGNAANDGYILYPVRGIRRKNIGEILLLSLYAPPSHPMGITLPPNSPWEEKIHDHWKAAAEQYSLPVHFDVGLNNSYEKLVHSAFSMITTSVNEGFGFAFLEPWTAEKYVFGRRVDHVYRDFTDSGMIFEDLYPSLQVPTDWFDMQDFCTRREKSIRRFGRLYGIDVSAVDVNRSSYMLSENRRIDFGMLDEAAQKQVIGALTSSADKRADFADENPVVTRFEQMAGKGPVIDNNRTIVLREYSRDQYRSRLLSVYSRVGQSSVEQRIDKDAVLDSFFNPVDFCMLRWPHVHE